jgi:hypothetical protein
MSGNGRSLKMIILKGPGYSAAKNKYIKCLPDTRMTHDDALINGENFSNKPGLLAVLNYKINFSTPGRYYVWARAYSTGSEDNGIHVGLNGELGRVRPKNAMVRREKQMDMGK